MFRRSSTQGKDKSAANSLGGGRTLRSSFVPGGSTNIELGQLEYPGQLLGEGSFGQVHLRRCTLTGQPKVVKTAQKQPGWDTERTTREAEVLRNLDHPHILRLFAWCEDAMNVYMIMEFCQGGEFLEAVRAAKALGQLLDEEWAATAMKQVLMGLAYIHGKGLIHKDLKSGNLLLMQSIEDGAGLFSVNPHVVLADLGLAEVCGTGGLFERRGKAVAGTASTMAPEVWKGSCGPKADIWSLGCVMYELVTGKLPFKASGWEPDVWLRQHQAGPDWSLVRLSKDAKTFCQGLLNFKERVRPSAKDCLKHQWFRICKVASPKEIESLCKAVLGWRLFNPIQRAIRLKIAAESTKINKFADVFTQFDDDASGSLSQEELVCALESIGVEKSRATTVASALDADGDGTCEYIEFVAACLPCLEEQFDEMLWFEYSALDPQQRGWLTKRDLTPLIEKLRPLASRHEFDWQDVDPDGDGVITFSEFASFFGQAECKYVPSVRHCCTRVQSETVGECENLATRTQTAPVKKTVRRRGETALDEIPTRARSASRRKTQDLAQLQATLQGQPASVKPLRRKPSASSTKTPSREASETTSKFEESLVEEDAQVRPSHRKPSMSSTKTKSREASETTSKFEESFVEGDVQVTAKALEALAPEVPAHPRIEKSWSLPLPSDVIGEKSPNRRSLRKPQMPVLMHPLRENSVKQTVSM